MTKVDNSYIFNLINRQGTNVPGEVNWSYTLDYDNKNAKININYIRFTGYITNIINSSVACNLSIDNQQYISNNDFSSNASYIDNDGQIQYINLTNSKDYYINKEGYIVYQNNGEEILCSSSTIILPFFDIEDIIKDKRLTSFILNLKLQVTAPTSYYSINFSEKEELISVQSGFTPCIAPKIVNNSKFITPRGKCSIVWADGTAGTGTDHAISGYKISVQYYVNTGKDNSDLTILTREVPNDSNTIILDFNEIIQNAQSFLERGTEVELRVSTMSNIDPFYNSIYSSASVEVTNILPNQPNILISNIQYNDSQGVLCSKVSPNTKVLIHAEPGAPNNEGQNSYVYYKRYTNGENINNIELKLYTSIIEEQVSKDIYYIFYTYDESFIIEGQDPQLEYSEPIYVHLIKDVAPSVKKTSTGKKEIYSVYSSSPYSNNAVTTTCYTESESIVTRAVWYIRYSDVIDEDDNISGDYTQTMICSNDVSTITNNTYTYTCSNIKQLLSVPYGYYYQIGVVLINNNLYETELVLADNYWEAESETGTKIYRKKGFTYNSNKFYFSDEKSTVSIIPNTKKETTINWSVTNEGHAAKASAQLYGALPTDINTPIIAPRHNLGNTYAAYYQNGDEISTNNTGVKITWNSNLIIPNGFNGLWYQFYYNINESDWMPIGHKTFFTASSGIIEYEDVEFHEGSNGCLIQYKVYIYRDISDDEHVISEASNSLIKIKTPVWCEGKDSFAYLHTTKTYRSEYIRPNFEQKKSTSVVSFGNFYSSKPGFGNDSNISNNEFTYEIYAKTSLATVCFSNGTFIDNTKQYSIDSDEFDEDVQKELFGDSLNNLFSVQFYMVFYDKFGQSITTKNITVYVDYREAPEWGDGNLMFGRTIKFVDTYTDNDPNYFIENSSSTDIGNFTALTGQYLTVKFPKIVNSYVGQKLKYSIELHEITYNSYYEIISTMSDDNLISTYTFLTEDIPTTTIENKGIRITDNDTMIEYRFTQLTSDLIGTAKNLGVLIRVQDQLSYEDNKFDQTSSYLIIGCTLSKPHIIITRSTCTYNSSGFLVANNIYNLYWPEQLLTYKALQKVINSVTHDCILTFEFAEGGAFGKKKSKINSEYVKYTNQFSGILNFTDSLTSDWQIESKTVYIRAKLTYHITDYETQTVYSQPYICYMEGPTISPRYHCVGINNSTLGADITPITLAISGFTNGTVSRSYLIMTDLGTTEPNYMIAYNHMLGKLYANSAVYANLCMQESELSEFDE